MFPFPWRNWSVCREAGGGLACLQCANFSGCTFTHPAILEKM